MWLLHHPLLLSVLTYLIIAVWPAGGLSDSYADLFIVHDAYIARWPHRNPPSLVHDYMELPIGPASLQVWLHS
jgi:hypothetical protein